MTETFPALCIVSKGVLEKNKNANETIQKILYDATSHNVYEIVLPKYICFESKQIPLQQFLPSLKNLTLVDDDQNYKIKLLKHGASGCKCTLPETPCSTPSRASSSPPPPPHPPGGPAGPGGPGGPGGQGPPGGPPPPGPPGGPMAGANAMLLQLHGPQFFQVPPLLPDENPYPDNRDHDRQQRGVLVPSLQNLHLTNRGIWHLVYGNILPGFARRNPYPQMNYWGRHFNVFLYSELLSDTQFKDIFVLERSKVYELRDRYARPFFDLLGPNGGVR